MTEGIASTVFAGDAADTLTSFDAYMADAAAMSRMDGFKTSLTGQLTVPDLNIPVPDTSSLTEGVNSLSNRIRKLAENDNFRRFKEIVGMIATGAAAGMSLARLQAAAVGLSINLPRNLQDLCDGIVANFQVDLEARFPGFDKVGPGGSRIVLSDQVECALQAMGMLDSVRGTVSELNNVLVDIEATATVMSGVIKTLIDYDLTEDISLVVSRSASDVAAKRAIGMSTGHMLASGNLGVINWMISEIGPADVSYYEPNATGLLLENFDPDRIDRADYEDTPAGDPIEYFFLTLKALDPKWDMKGQLYYFPNVGELSPGAQKAMETYDPYRSVSAGENVEFFPSSSVRDPTHIEVMRDLYPGAVGTGQRNPGGGTFDLSPQAQLGYNALDYVFF